MYNKTPKSAAIASKEGEEKFLEKEYFCGNPRQPSISY
jgi:hypothetical protein